VYLKENIYQSLVKIGAWSYALNENSFSIFPFTLQLVVLYASQRVHVINLTDHFAKPAEKQALTCLLYRTVLPLTHPT
jgi:hypothetical protein